MDEIINLGNSMIQHGKHNDRVYLMKLDKNDVSDVLYNIEEKAKENDYSKIFAKVPYGCEKEFLAKGYMVEGHVPEMVKGENDVLFLGKFLKEWRSKDEDPNLKLVLEKALRKKEEGNTLNNENKLISKYYIRLLDKKDSKEMAKVYSEVFETYPFPIHDPNYIEETMDDNLVYFGVFMEGKLIAISSCEMDVKNLNVEMTDFATLPECRGNGLAVNLLMVMEEEMVRRDIKTAYTIARAKSYGMNITFAKLEYEHSGTLIKNTNIGGDFETMNIWWKKLKK
ncbi:beta-lysine acetyltransferase [Natranaerovirga pectinivora]|uniref:Beta-lysine acetyltransferase n=1 Tax=Natranaerovirga pectinivora TaxID=682400 RepID=A0A4R3MMT0_9FIRM|nr:putative beta-lysine N-acetyltransferase [Natranaerovirga pectinivora]TCT13843.1 beta-lysine acetyltransferase [Natranaerovirga pectinivora]